jgi:hypothetical protein
MNLSIIFGFAFVIQGYFWKYVFVCMHCGMKVMGVDL